MSDRSRISVIVPCFGDGPLVREAVHSIEEPEPIEIVIVDDGSTDEPTKEALESLEGDGFRVVRHPRNLGVSAARMTGLGASAGPLVFPLDADDLAIPGALSAMAGRLERSPEAAVCFGDYLEFGDHELIRAVPEDLDPYRIAYTNEYPPSMLIRRGALLGAGGWRRVSDELDARSDWGLWMGLAERGARGIHFGSGRLTYAHRFHGPRLAAAGRNHHRAIYRALRRQHPNLFASLRRHRRRSRLDPLRRLLYPIVYGGRPRWHTGEPRLKALLDRLGVWTLTRPMSPEQRQAIGEVLIRARRAAAKRMPAGDPRVAVIVPCHNDGRFVGEAVRSIREPEPVEIIVVDDGSTDRRTERELAGLEAEGVRVVRHERNRGLSAARATGLRETSAPYLAPLDSDDLAVSGALSLMADKLDADPGAGMCFGDYLEFGDRELLRAVPTQLDPFRVVYTNEYPISTLFRRSTLHEAGGWSLEDAYEDWDLWMTLAERGVRGVHLGPSVPSFRKRIHSNRLGAIGRARQADVYRKLRDRHPNLFGRVRDHRRESAMPPARKLLYPMVYGGRPRWSVERPLKGILDRVGVWTLSR